jgi:hypothetical protein
MKSTPGPKNGRTGDSIAAYNAAQPGAEALICRRLRAEIERALPDATSKVWHGAPVWFVGDTPVVGYSVPARGGVALLFWNGRAFGDPELKAMGKFKAAQIQFEDASEIKAAPLRRWLRKAGTDLWDVSSIRMKRRNAADAAKGRVHTTYHKDGTIYAKGRMLGGKMHGYWEFFRKDGTIMRSGSFDRERQIGTWTTYDADGRPVKVTEMKTGAPRKAKPGARTAGKGG